MMAKQYGAISRAQAFSCGLSQREIEGRVARGEWLCVHPGVYRSASVQPSYEQTVMGAYLWAGAGAVVSHRSAGALLGLRGVSTSAIDLTRTSGKHAPAGVTVHVTRNLPGRDTARLGSFVITRVARTIIDLAAVVDEETLENALDGALTQGRATLPQLADRLDELGSRGRPGARALRALLKERIDGMRPTESALEVKFRRLAKQAGLPRPVAQYKVALPDGRVARIDFAWPDLLIGVECDGWEDHSAKQAWEHDIDRANQLATLGWRLVRVPWNEIEKTVAHLRRAIR